MKIKCQTTENKSIEFAKMQEIQSYFEKHVDGECTLTCSEGIAPCGCPFYTAFFQIQDTDYSIAKSGNSKLNALNNLYAIIKDTINRM